MQKIIIILTSSALLANCASRTTIGPDVEYAGNIRSNTMHKNEFTLFTDTQRLPIRIPAEIAGEVWEKCKVKSNGFNFRPQKCKFEGTGQSVSTGSSGYISIKKFKMKD